ncbi:MAG TPA: hypothetical protein VFG20_02310 [Planctomycetaceae bacterium]|nr:hypothetical protein [Planctomycetaceae bacterium]
MFHGIATLMARSLRLDARQLQTHLFRLAFVLIIYFMMMAAQIQSMMFGAPGLQFFMNMIFLNVSFIALGGISFFSSAITEEKEEDTIGLLMMAGISPLGILLGKSTARLFQALLLLTVQFPFTLLAITLGGVTLKQVIASYVALLAFTVLMANVGLLCSVISRRSGSAAGLTAIWLLLHGLAPNFVEGPAALLRGESWATGTFWGRSLIRVLDLIVDADIIRRLIAIVTTGFDDPIITTQVVTNVAGGVVFFLLSWTLFLKFALAADVQGVSRGMLVRSERRASWIAAGRAWSNPLVWKEYNFLTGGRPYLWAKLFGFALLYPALFPVLAGIRYLSGDPQPWQVEGEVMPAHFTIVIAVLVIELSIYSSRLFHDEIRLQTLSSILMLPCSIAYVGYSKLAGMLLGTVPTLVFVILDSVLVASRAQDWFEVVSHPGFWFPVVMFTVFLHLVVLLSLFVKWGALPLAFFVMLVSTYCCPVFIVLAMVASEGGPLGHFIVLGLAWTLFVVATFVFQMMIHARLYELGAK